eukprot:1155556-Pelagomonas_calceolata.AAC.3
MRSNTTLVKQPHEYPEPPYSPERMKRKSTPPAKRPRAFQGLQGVGLQDRLQEKEGLQSKQLTASLLIKKQ